jgi:hypothetical protein
MFNLVNAHQFDKSLLTSWNWLLQKVTCPQCNKSICHQSLTHHLHEQHRFPSLQVPKMYTINPGWWYTDNFPVQHVPIKCPVNGCPMHLKTWALAAMMAFLYHAHWWWNCHHTRRWGSSPPTLPQLHWGEVLDFGQLSDISTYIAQQKMSLLNQYAKPERYLFSLCKNSTPMGSGAHHQMWWT